MDSDMARTPRKKALPSAAPAASKEDTQVFMKLLKEVSKVNKEYPLPETIRVVGKEFHVVQMPPTSELAGQMDPGSLTIKVADGQAPIEEADTLLHEVLHAIEYVLDLKLTERQIRIMATGRIGAFQDNPEFAEFVTRPLGAATKKAKDIERG